MGALRGELRKLDRLRDQLRGLPRGLAAHTAKVGAPALTTTLQGTYESGANAYGDPNPPGVDGQQLTLKKTGALDAALRFSFVGSIIRTPELPRYARYLIGKYNVLPNGNAAIPTAWKALLDQATKSYKPPAL